MPKFKHVPHGMPRNEAGTSARPAETVFIAGLAVPRLLHAAASLFYLFLFLDVYQRYLSVVWNYTGLRYRDLSIAEYSSIAAGVAIVAFSMPTRISRPSSIVLWLMFAFVYVPTMAITMMVGYQDAVAYVGPLAALSGGFLLACVVSQQDIPDESRPAAVPGPGFQQWMLLAGVIATIILFLHFRSILSFANIDRIYIQRVAATKLANVFIDYLSTYYSYVFGTGLFAIGLVTRNRVAFVVGAISFLLTYMIGAQKISLLVPVTVIAVYLLTRLTRNFTSYYTLGMCGLVAFCSFLSAQPPPANYFANLILSRAISIPAQLFSQYYDFFGKMGFTWWSNIKGISLIVPAPAAFASDPYWPKLGILVGREYSGTVLQNSNANLFAGEGVAAAGTLGVLVIGAIWSAWLRSLDLAARGWDRTFVLLVLAPIGLCLTNGHLSTVLLSFGGFFWLATFWFYKPVR